MDALVDVLAPGYSQWLDNGQTSMRANGSCTLVRSACLNVLVDCMSPWDGARLTSLLAERGLHPDDIHYLVCTHTHPDHAGNLNLFTKAKVQIVGYSVFAQDLYTMHPFDENVAYPLSAGIEVIPTPGHTLSDVSVCVKQSSKLGRVVVAGDLFESERDLVNDQIWIDAGSECPEKQRANRAMVLSMADYVVPGHGDIFKVCK